MKVFLSWSGDLSHNIAKIMKAWIPSVLPNVEPWLSSEEIPKGSRWASVLADRLKKTSYGIVIVVPGNVSSPWLNFEIGAISTSLSESYMSPFIFGLATNELAGRPLSQFQATKFDKADVWLLVSSMNDSLGDEGHSEDGLRERFESHWPDLEFRIWKLFPEGLEDDLYIFSEESVQELSMMLHQADEPGFSHAFGESVPDQSAVNGRAWYAGTGMPCPIHLIYGPYTDLPKEGEYWAIFKLKIDNTRITSEALHLDVISNKNPRLNSYKILRSSQFPEADRYQLFGVKFRYEGEEDVEYRVIKLEQQVQVWIDYIAIAKYEDLSVETT